MPRHKREKGVTMIELVAVLIILGILAAVAIVRFGSTAEVDLKAQTEVLKSHIRYSQLRAMNADADKTTNLNCESSFGINTSINSYFMFRDCSTATTVRLPGAESNSISLPSGMALTATTITFDEWGRPCTDMDGKTIAAADIPLTLNYGGSSETITITKNTGFVP
ncbi:MAG: type II secretion system protein [bacterium]